MGNNHFATGRVLDTLGMLYAAKGSFHAARDFFDKAIQCKHLHGDDAGLALSHGQLGQLYFDWGLHENPERHFQDDMQICQRIDDELGLSLMYNGLGRLALERGSEELNSGRLTEARIQLQTAASWLDAAIQLSQQHAGTIREAYNRKDRALVHLAGDDADAAAPQLQRAEQLFRGVDFQEGVAHVCRASGRLHCKRGILI